MKRYGTRNDVYEGLAEKTRGGLTRDDLVLSKTGKIVSKKKSLAARAAYEKFGFAKRTKEKVEEEEKPVAEEAPKKKRRKRKQRKDSK